MMWFMILSHLKRWTDKYYTPMNYYQIDNIVITKEDSNSEFQNVSINLNG